MCLHSLTTSEEMVEECCCKVVRLDAWAARRPRRAWCACGACLRRTRPPGRRQWQAARRRAALRARVEVAARGGAVESYDADAVVLAVGVKAMQQCAVPPAAVGQGLQLGPQRAPARIQ